MFDKKQQWITSTLESGSGDLNSLMTSVYDIIEIVKSLTKSINNLGGYEDDKESVLISEFEECLASIGLNLEGLIAPQPSNMLGSDKKSIINKSSYYESLATELANFLSKLFLSPDKRLNPIVPWSMAVSEVYLAFNITRGRG